MTRNPKVMSSNTGPAKLQYTVIIVWTCVSGNGFERTRVRVRVLYCVDLCYLS